MILSQELFAALTATDGKGRPVHEPAEIRRVLPLLVFLSNAKSAPPALPGNVAELVAQFLVSLGVSTRLSDSEIAERIMRYYAEHPPDARLLAAIGAVLGRAGAATDVETLLRGVSFLGTKQGAPAQTRPSQHQEPPAGTARGGPLARQLIARLVAKKG